MKVSAVLFCAGSSLVGASSQFHCCYDGCGNIGPDSCEQPDTWCGASKDQCLQCTNAQWCDGLEEKALEAEVVVTNSKCPAPMNCFHPDWADQCSCAGNEQLCEASSTGAEWLGYKGQCDGPTPVPTPTPPAPSQFHCCYDGCGNIGPDSCEQPDTWCGASKDQCVQCTNAQWCDGLEEEALEAEVVVSNSKCPAPNNCYHPDWADKCSCAGNEQLCEASSTGAEWLGYKGQCDGPTPVPTPTPPAPPSQFHCCYDGCGNIGPDSCEQPDTWCGASKDQCVQCTNAQWCDGLEEEALEAEVVVPFCPAPLNCYHPDWADKCSCAGNEQLCEASSTGAEWLGYKGPCDKTPPAPPSQFHCCYDGCGNIGPDSCEQPDTWCGASESQCKQCANAQWCPGVDEEASTFAAIEVV